MEKRKKNDVAALLRYAGGHKGLTFLGLALSGIAMLLSMAPYICIWHILAGGYFLFFTSKIWMPNNETLIEPTSLYARQVMDRHEVYLSQYRIDFICKID